MFLVSFDAKRKLKRSNFYLKMMSYLKIMSFVLSFTCTKELYEMRAFEFSRNTQSWIFCTTSNGNKLETV